MPRYSGVTMRAWWPARASALPSAPTISASSPVLENGWTSLLARRTFIHLRFTICDLRVARRLARKSQVVNRKWVTGWSRANLVCFQIGLKRFGDLHAAVGLLIGFHQSHKQPRQGRAAAIENMWKFVFARFRLEPQIHPARLEIFAV